jgi:hypothetical protein
VRRDDGGYANHALYWAPCAGARNRRYARAAHALYARVHNSLQLAALSFITFLAGAAHVADVPGDPSDAARELVVCREFAGGALLTVGCYGVLMIVLTRAGMKL